MKEDLSKRLEKQTNKPKENSLSSPLLPSGVRKQPQDLVVQRSHLLRLRQLLSQFDLQAVASTVLGLQVLDGANAPGERVDR